MGNVFRRFASVLPATTIRNQSGGNNVGNRIQALNFIHFNDVYDLSRVSRFYHVLEENGYSDKLRLFSGDMLFPNILATAFKGLPSQKAFELLKFDYAVAGNHEFDQGVKRFEELVSPYDTKWVMSNFKHRETGVPLGNAKRFEIFERGGLKVGIFGLIDDHWLDSAIPIEDHELVDFKQMAVEVSRELHEKGCDLVICLTHMMTASDEVAVELSSHVDLFLGGHEHVYFLHHSNGRLALKSGSDFEEFSDVSLVLEDQPLSDALPDGFRFSSRHHTAEGPSEFSFSLPRNQRFLNVRVRRVGAIGSSSRFQPFEDFFEASTRELRLRLGTPAIRLQSGGDLTSSKMRRSESGLANLTCDLARIDTEVDIVLHNAGGLRSSRVLPPDDSLTFLELLELDPWQDHFALLEINAETLAKLLSQAYEGLPSLYGRFLHPSGLKVTVNVRRVPAVRVEDISFHGRPLGPDEVLKLAAPGFVARGRDGLSALANSHIRPIGSAIYDFLAEFARLPQNSAHREEFALFKSTLSHLEDSDLVKAIRVATRPGLSTLAEMPSFGSLQERLASLSPECLRRLRKYRLAEEIVEDKGVFVFAIKGIPDGRLTFIDSSSEL